MRSAPLLLALLATPALAETASPAWTSSDGVLFLAAPGEGGAALRSEGEVTYHVGAAGVAVTGMETVLLRPDCTARSALGGAGAWMRLDDGFMAWFVEGSGLWFEHQAPPAGAGPDC